MGWVGIRCGIGGWGGGSIPNKASDHRTFIPANAGNLSFKKFMILLNSVATAPGFVTRSFKVGTFTLTPSFCAIPVAWVTYSDFKPCFSAAAARISGPREPVSLVGRDSMSFCRKEGRVR